MTNKSIIDPESNDGGLPKKNMHWKIVLLLAGVVLVAAYIKFGGKSVNRHQFNPTPPHAAELGPAADPSSIDKDKQAAEQNVQLEKVQEAKQKADAVKKQQELLAAQSANSGRMGVAPTETPAASSTVGLPPSGALPPLPPAMASKGAGGGRSVADPDRESMIRNSPVLVKSNSAQPAGAQANTPPGYVPPQMTDLQRSELASASDMSSILKNMPGAQGGTAPGAGATANAQWLSDYSSKLSDHSAQTAYAPPAKYYVRSNTLIQAVTTRMIDSDLSGPIEMQVVSDVYDSVTGTQIMIPAGSTISGGNNGDVRLGQSRIEAAVGRICRPDGICVDAPGSQGADSSGATGLSGDVNNHILQIFATAIIPAAIAYATTPSNSGNGNVYAGGSSPINAAGQIMVQTSQTVLNRYNNVPPTIKVPPGSPVSIVIGKDLVLPPYHR
ncbi:TrbI/VirB10 family protein [Paraburkholderia fungorum]|uniref:Type IV secretion system protein VirB10 n=1 Tax=Paraburkholderia fungorum TaxID=134537 RepID=A0AAW3V322_9BURK|nr:TrbI/VirB10 family protein [Paraburkholderia fungorum]MBB4518710.1 type IV secretion system protein VirB10 [Paraburkholderia fungorum]MBB6204195.1 type IV secretion system protein VirB10 [Paraburkholderia fungorum]